MVDMAGRNSDGFSVSGKQLYSGEESRKMRNDYCRRKQVEDGLVLKEEENERIEPKDGRTWVVSSLQKGDKSHERAKVF